ncbi:unnamed protein product, partial [Ectocarpus sp. 12 AP-2014]
PRSRTFLRRCARVNSQRNGSSNSLQPLSTPTYAVKSLMGQAIIFPSSKTIDVATVFFHHWNLRSSGLQPRPLGQVVTNCHCDANGRFAEDPSALPLPAFLFLGVSGVVEVPHP